jgi:hypothetical protein
MDIRTIIALRQYSRNEGRRPTGVLTAPSEPGEYQVICSEPGHLELGMTGVLIVTPGEGRRDVALQRLYASHAA